MEGGGGVGRVAAGWRQGGVGRELVGGAYVRWEVPLGEGRAGKAEEGECGRE